MSESAIFDLKRTVLAPVGTRLYAVGDLHGRKDLLDRMLTLILADARGSQAGRRVIVFLGDYVDRGPQSRQVVDTLVAGPPASPQWAGFRWVCLKGNHEDAMLGFLDDIESGPRWFANGGLATIESYVGDLSIDRLQLPGLQALLQASLPPSHRAFLEGLPLHHCEGDYLFVHAGLRPGVPLEAQEPNDLLWIRGEFLTSPADHGKLVVHGHTITRTPELRRNRIGIDTGAFYTGRLTCLVAEGAKRKFLST
jgi:serine/threonine protein phosphatase 1